MFSQNIQNNRLIKHVAIRKNGNKTMIPLKFHTSNFYLALLPPAAKSSIYSPPIREKNQALPGTQL